MGINIVEIHLYRVSKMESTFNGFEDEHEASFDNVNE